MPGVTKEQIEQAKRWDLLSYLQTYEPKELIKCGRNEYCTASNHALKISNGLWHWHSQGIGGKTALDYLIKVRGLGFVDAVKTLSNTRVEVYHKISIPAQKVDEPKSFELPEVNYYGNTVTSYLQKRGINADIINKCIGAGILYEERKHRNCVFVGRDKEGTARYAALRGTFGSFRMDAKGSDKRYSFCLPAADKNSKFVAVAESPIDALSIATALKLQGDDWSQYHYLSLGGTATRALLQFLHDHPSVTHISLCLDNDSAGLLGMTKIREAIRADPIISQRIKLIVDNPPAVGTGKDYNEFLQKKIAVSSLEKVKNKGIEK